MFLGVLSFSSYLEVSPNLSGFPSDIWCIRHHVVELFLGPDCLGNHDLAQQMIPFRRIVRVRPKRNDANNNKKYT